MNPPDEFFAMRVFKYSIVYLVALFAFLLVDHYLIPAPAVSAGLNFQRIDY
jgi:protoheme IX farnesyltransferase